MRTVTCHPQNQDLPSSGSQLPEPGTWHLGTGEIIPLLAPVRDTNMLNPAASTLKGIVKGHLAHDDDER